MSDQPSLSAGHPWHDYLVLLMLFIAVYGINLFISRDLWVQDEARYGEVVREMLASRDWLVPHLNGYPYPDKPPLYFWVVALMGSLVGHGELAFRLVTALTTLAAVAAVYWLGLRLAGRPAGFWAAALFATMILTLIVGQIARMDMMLTAAATFAWYALLCFRASRTWGALAAFWALSALAVAIKGPIGLLFTVLPGLLWLAIEDGWPGVRALRPLTGLSALAALLALWIGAVAITGHEQYLWTIWHEQLVGRAINSWSHREPVYFYIVLAPLLFLPWTGLVVWGGWRLIKERTDGRWAIAVFSLAPLLGISLVSGKLFIYMQPLLPAVCLAAGIAAASLSGQPRVSGWIAWPPTLFMALLALLAAGGAGFLYQYVGSLAWQGFAVALGLLLVAGAGAFLATLNGCRWLYGWLGATGVVSWLVFALAHALVNPLFSARALGESAARHAGPNAPVGVANTTRGILNYYSGRLMTEVAMEDVVSWWRAHPDAVLILKRADVRHVFGDQGVPKTCAVQERYVVEFQDYYVLARCPL